MHFIVVDDRGRLIAGACSSPDVARLVALLEDESASVRTLDVPESSQGRLTQSLPRGWRILKCEDCDDRTHTEAFAEAVASAAANASIDATQVENDPDGAPRRR